MGPPVDRPTIEFRALGTPELSRADAELQSILARPKLLGLLAFLACSPPGFHRRDTLLGLFWAEMDEDRARRALRQSLYYLRQSLGRDVLVGRGEDELGLQDDRMWCDVRTFEAALDAGREEDALDLYRGDLLGGFFLSSAPEFERWLDERRQALRRKASGAAWSLARAKEAAGNAAGAGHWARRATTLEPFDEHVLTNAVELLDRMGDRAGALHLYEAFARRLEDELEIDPAPETRALVARIRSRAAAESSPAAAEPAVPGTDPATGAGGMLPAEPDLEVAQASEASGLRRVRPRRRTIAILATAFAVVGIALYQGLGPGAGNPEVDPGRVVVAVFDNQTGDARLDPLGRMAADWVTQALHESGVVDVVPSTIGLAPRPDFTDGEPSDAVALAEALDAGTLLTGAYYQRGDSVEIQAQVIDVRRGDLLSALPPAVSPIDAPGAAVDSLSRHAVRTLAVLFDPSLATSADLNRPPTLDAYRQYLEGLRYFQRIPLEMDEALRYFYRALELDSAFLAPRFYIIMAHGNLNQFTLADSNARVLARERTRLSDDQRHMLDWLTARVNGDQMAALEAARARGGLDVGIQALAVNRPAEAVEVLSAEDLTPFYFKWLALMEAYHMLGDFQHELDEARRGRDAYPGRLRMLDAELRALAALGRPAQVERLLDEVEQLPHEAPFTPGMVMVNTAAEFQAHGHEETAMQVARRAVRWWHSRSLDPPSRPDRFSLALALILADRPDEADTLLRELATEGEDTEVATLLATLAARRGEATTALGISSELQGRGGPGFGGDSYLRARIAARLGDRDGAVTLLREAIANGMAFSIWLHRDIDLQPLRGYPPYEELIRPKG